MITIHEASLTSIPTTMGFGSLPDAISCVVKEELNGSFELEMEYPITGLHFNEIQLRRLIYCKSNPFSDSQLFRIYSITKPIDGVITINAEHISYDLSGYPIRSIDADSADEAFRKIPESIPLNDTGETDSIHCPFTFWTDITSSGEIGEEPRLSVVAPVSVRAFLGEEDKSVVSMFGGEYEFDNFSVKLHNNRGYDRGVHIVYGKNLIDLEQEENCNSVYTAIYPYTYSDDEGLTELYGVGEIPDKYVPTGGTYNYTRILPVDLTSKWESAPIQSELYREALLYIAENKLGIPEVSLTVSFVNLEGSPEFRDVILLEKVYLGDVVTVEFPLLGVNATAKCISTTYDVILDRYTETELGSPKIDIGDIILDQGKRVVEAVEEVIGENVPTKSFVEEAAMNAAKLVSGGLGGYIVLHDSRGGNYPDEILIMDTDNIQTAQKIWRFNQNGLMYSNTGYDGQYAITAITNDGKINASLITAGEFNGQYIKANSIDANKIKANSLTTREINFNDSGVQSSIQMANGTLTLSVQESTPPIRNLVAYNDFSVNSEESGIFYYDPYYIDGKGSPGDRSLSVNISGFQLDHVDSSGCEWYVSTNTMVDNSESYATITFHSFDNEDIIMRCISYGESGYDFGIISEVDQVIPKGYINLQPGSSNYALPTVRSKILKHFRDESSPNYQDVIISKPEGGYHTITVKYEKDSSDNQFDDKFMFTFLHYHETPGTNPALSLNRNGISISTVGIDLFGMVTFHALETEGLTRINGGNIDTENLRVDEVKYYDGTYWYPIISGKISGSNTLTYVGPRNVINKSYHSTYLFGTDTYFLPVGVNTSDSPIYVDDALIISPAAHTIYPYTNSSWNIGSDQKCFDSIYVKKVYLVPETTSSHGLYLENYRGTLQWDGSPV